MIRTLAAITLIFAALSAANAQPPAIGPEYDPTGEYVTHDDVRNGGVLERSYAYHQTPYTPVASPQPSIMPANGAYGYGFPVTTYRWGWFGASRYYPHVFWFKGYYNDCTRCGYRQGY